MQCRRIVTILRQQYEIVYLLYCCILLAFIFMVIGVRACFSSLYKCVFLSPCLVPSYFVAKSSSVLIRAPSSNCVFFDEFFVEFHSFFFISLLNSCCVEIVKVEWEVVSN